MSTPDPDPDTITIERDDLTNVLTALADLGEEWQHAIPLMDEDDRRSYEQRALELEQLTARLMRLRDGRPRAASSGAAS